MSSNMQSNAEIRRSRKRERPAPVRSSRSLHDMDAKFRSILESIEDAYYEVDLKGALVLFNPAFCGLLGYSAAELRGRHYSNYMRPEAAARAYRIFNEVYRTGIAANAYDCELTRKDGHRVLAEGSVHLVKDGAGTIVGFRGILRNVTERRREEELRTIEHAVTRGLAEADTVSTALQAVMWILCDSEQWDSGCYFRVVDRVGNAKLVMTWSGSNAASGAAEHYDDAEAPIVPAGSLLSQIIATKEPLFSTAFACKENPMAYRANAKEASAHDFFGFPVIAAGEVIGIFGFTVPSTGQPDDRLLQAVRMIGNLVGQFLQRKQAEDVLRESEARFRALADLSSDWYWEQDTEFRFTRFEGRLVLEEPDMFNSALGKCPWHIFEAVGGALIQHRLTVQARKPFRDLALWTDRFGERRHVSVSGEPVFDARRQFLGYRGVGRDITQQKTAERRIQYLATHDPLTELPNRALFTQLLHVAIAGAQRYDRRFAVLFIDIDRFKVINDTLGHHAGDKLLQEIGARLKQTLRASDVIARFGGDEFAVMVQEVSEPGQIVAIARKILAAISRPVELLALECRVTASVGIAMYPSDAQDEHALMKNADMAMYLAKEEGKNTFQFYSQNIQKQSVERLALETRLRRALERDEFSLNYQAKVDLKTGRVTGVEALLRWQNPELGSVSPAQFIPIAEETGLIGPIGQWVLKTACAQNVAWQRQGLPPVHIAVNLSARQFADENLLTDIANVLDQTGLRPELLELEITEGMVMHNAERAASLLTAIKGMGVRLAMDDFGTGYSSLAHIKRFPLDTLKVDRSFIRDIPQDAEDKAITEAIIAMAKTLELTVVAEGVETREQAEFLREHDCDEMQGYLFSKPVDSMQFAELLRAQAASPNDFPTH